MSDPMEEWRRRERDLYVRCWELFQAEDLAPLIEETLGRLRELVGAKLGYIDITDVTNGKSEQWFAGTGIDTIELPTENSNVLCFPIVAEDVAGIVCLRDRIQDGPFHERDIRCAETIARFMSSAADRIVEL